MRAKFASLVVLTLLIFGCGGTTLVQNPQPLAGAGTIETTEQAILDTLPKRRWSLETMEPGHIVAFLAVRAHLLRVDIFYDAQAVNIRYRDSDNLNERPTRGGQLAAHRKVNMWMEQLARDINEELSRPRTAGGQYSPPPGQYSPPPPPAQPSPAPEQTPAPASPDAVRDQIQGAPAPQ